MDKAVHHTGPLDKALTLVAPKPFRLSMEDRDRLCNAFEHAINSGHDELRGYMHGGAPVFVPVRLGRVA